MTDDEFAAVVERDRERFVRIAAGYACVGASDAEDVVQMALMKAWEKRRTFRGDSQIRTWIIAVLVNEVLMTFRRAKYQRRVAEIQPNDGEPRIAPGQEAWTELRRLPLADILPLLTEPVMSQRTRTRLSRWRRRQSINYAKSLR